MLKDQFKGLWEQQSRQDRMCPPGLAGMDRTKDHKRVCKSRGSSTQIQMGY